MWYNLNFNKLIVQLLPTFLRKQRMIAFLSLFSEELLKLHNQWLQEKKNHEEWLFHNSQVCYLRKALNDEFDDLERGIRITDGQLYDRQYLFTLGENKPRKIGKIFLRPASDYADTGIDFFVVFPKTIDINNNNYKQEALVNRYKLASKRYKIIHNE